MERATVLDSGRLRADSRVWEGVDVLGGNRWNVLQC